MPSGTKVTNLEESIAKLNEWKQQAEAEAKEQAGLIAKLDYYEHRLFDVYKAQGGILTLEEFKDREGKAFEKKLGAGSPTSAGPT